MSFYECACNNESEKVILEKATSAFTENDLFTLMRIIDRRYTMEDVEFALGEEDTDENKLREIANIFDEIEGDSDFYNETRNDLIKDAIDEYLEEK